MKKQGNGLILLGGCLLVMLMAGAFAIDSGLYFAVHKGMQNAADAAALASAAELFRNPTLSTGQRLDASRNTASDYSLENMGNALDTQQDVTFGYIDPTTGDYNPATFSGTNPAFYQTGGYNAVRVSVKRGEDQANPQVPAIFSRYLGIAGFDSQADAVAMYGGSIGSYTSLRPIYLCQGAWDKATTLYGDPTAPEVTFYNANLTVGTTNVTGSEACGNLPTGSFGLADFTNSGGSPGSAQVRSWFGSGYPNPVASDQAYEPQTGNSLNSYRNELESLKSNETVVVLPLYNQSTGLGANAKFVVSGFVGFVISDYQTTGSNKYIRGHFKKMICNRNCSLATTPVGGSSLTKLRLVH